MFKNIKGYLDYTRGQKNGILVLVVLILAVFIAPKFIYLITPDKKLDYSEFESQISKFEKRIVEKDSKSKTQLFSFDPNTVDKAKLLKLGLSKKQANQIINYRNSGGRFYEARHLKKIYSIDSNQYKILEPFINIKQNTATYIDTSHTVRFELKQRQKQKESAIVEKIMVELNTADSIDLIQLDGIGVSISRRILNYRNYLGGYVSTQQLLEVYGLKPKTFNSIKKNIIIDSTLIQKININGADFKTLNKHPYLSYVNTKKILKYRQLMGELKSLNELIEHNLIDTINYTKIYPYLSLN